MKRFRIDVRSTGYLIAFVFFLLFTVHCSLLTISAQDDDLAPPPVRSVTKEEKARLNELSDLKTHTKLALELMNARLTSAERLSSLSDFDAMFRELGGFHGLMDNTLEFLSRNNNDSGRALDNYKRLEIGLRGFTPRIEAVRRDLPLRYEDYVRSLLKYVREARSRAIEPFFDDTVIRMKKPIE
ncbi:MAG: hypothetical protein ACKVQJ_05115 [Pyrinomonadaceae bacterium]